MAYIKIPMFNSYLINTHIKDALSETFINVFRIYSTYELCMLLIQNETKSDEMLICGCNNNGSTNLWLISSETAHNYYSGVCHEMYITIFVNITHF